VSAATVSRYLTRQGLVTPEPAQAPEVVLPAVCRRPAQRVLAVRLHPLPTRRRDRYRDPGLAR
jgi:hypothetical protein